MEYPSENKACLEFRRNIGFCL